LEKADFLTAFFTTGNSSTRNAMKYPAADLRASNSLKNLLPLDGGGLRWG
jgi:hypothetical protein